MRAGELTVLAVCGGGGNDTLAAVIVLAVVTAYLLLVGAVFVRSEDGVERGMLALLLVASAVLGTGIFSVLGTSVGSFVLALIVPAALAVLSAASTRQGSVGRAVFVALAGSSLIPGGLFLLIFASAGIGTACFD
jgi:hypothetical protein